MIIKKPAEYPFRTNQRTESGAASGDSSHYGADAPHLDGYNLLPYLEGQEAHSPRKNFFYFNNDGQLVAVRHENFKYVFCEQRVVVTRGKAMFIPLSGSG